MSTDYPMFKVSGRDYDDKVILEQITHAPKDFFELRFTAVWAHNIASARLIQRAYRANNYDPE